MLVVNRVELIFRDELEQVRKLERDDAAGLQRDLQAADEIVDVGDVGHDVIAKQQVGGLAVGDKFLRRLHAEKFHDARNLFLLPRDFRDVGGRFDAEHGDALRLEVLEQIAVIAGDFDDLAFGVEAESLDHHVAVAPRMFDPARRETGEIEIVAEDRVGGFKLVELREQAVLGNPDLERIMFFGGVGVLEFHIRVGHRRHAEIAHDVLERFPAETAFRISHKRIPFSRKSPCRSVACGSGAPAFSNG